MDAQLIALFGIAVGAGLIGYVFVMARKGDKETQLPKDGTEVVTLVPTVTTLSAVPAVPAVPVKSEPVSKGRYVGRSSVLSKPERIMFQRLREALPDKLIFAQVSVNRLIDSRPEPGSFKSVDYSLFGKINGKSFDFVICDENTVPLVAVELDDSSHYRADRKKADAQKNEACEQAGIRLVRFKVSQMPATTELANLLTPAKE